MNFFTSDKFNLLNFPLRIPFLPLWRICPFWKPIPTNRNNNGKFNKLNLSDNDFNDGKIDLRAICSAPTSSKHSRVAPDKFNYVEFSIGVSPLSMPPPGKLKNEVPFFKFLTVLDINFPLYKCHCIGIADGTVFTVP